MSNGENACESRAITNHLDKCNTLVDNGPTCTSIATRLRRGYREGGGFAAAERDVGQDSREVYCVRGDTVEERINERGHVLVGRNRMGLGCGGGRNLLSPLHSATACLMRSRAAMA
jgi:hypothetical protein